METAIYIVQDNPVRALSFVDELEATCLGLGQTANIGTARPELGDEICLLPHVRHLIFYRKHRSLIRVERVMHGARDIGGDDFEA